MFKNKWSFTCVCHFNFVCLHNVVEYGVVATRTAIN